MKETKLCLCLLIVIVHLELRIVTKYGLPQKPVLSPNKSSPVIQARMSHADMSHTISTLRSICHTAQKIRKLTEAQAAEAPSYKSPHTFPELQLSFPDEVLSTLKSMDLPTNIYGNLRKKLFSWYQQMQVVHQRHYIQTCQRLCSVHVKSATFESIRLAFEASFSKRYVPVIISHVRNLKERYHCDWQQRPQSHRQPFQQVGASAYTNTILLTLP